MGARVHGHMHEVL